MAMVHLTVANMSLLLLVNPAMDGDGGSIQRVEYGSAEEIVTVVVFDIGHYRALIPSITLFTLTSAQTVTLPNDVTWTEIDRVIYFPDTDVLYLGGYTTEYPNNLGWWGMVGHVIQKYENWSQGNRKASLKIVLPSDNTTDPYIGIKAACIVGDYVFAVDSRYAHVYVLSTKDGSMVGYMKPNADVGGVSGWVDTPYGIEGVKLSSGEYVIYVEEDWDARILMYRWTP